MAPGVRDALYRKLNRHFPLNEMTSALTGHRTSQPADEAHGQRHAQRRAAGSNFHGADGYNNNNNADHTRGQNTHRNRDIVVQRHVSEHNQQQHHLHGSRGQRSDRGEYDIQEVLPAATTSLRAQRHAPPLASSHARRAVREAPRYDFVETESFQLGRPGELQGPYGVEHVADRPRLPRLKLPHNPPDMSYARTMHFTVYPSPGADILLRFVDDNITHNLYHARSVGGPSKVITLEDISEHVLLKMFPRPFPSSVAATRHPMWTHSERQRPQFAPAYPRAQQETQQGSASPIFVVVTNEWDDPLISITVPPQNDIAPASLHHTPTGPTSRVPYHPRSAPFAIHPPIPQDIQQPYHQTYGRQGPSSDHTPYGTYFNSDNSFAPHPQAGAAVSPFVPTPHMLRTRHLSPYEIFDYDEPAIDASARPRSAPSHGVFPSEMHLSWSNTSLNNGDCGDGGAMHGPPLSPSGLHGTGRDDFGPVPHHGQAWPAQQYHPPDNSVGVNTVGFTGSTAEANVYTGEMDAPNRPVLQTPLLRLISAPNPGRQALVNSEDNELAVISYPMGGGATMSPKFQVTVHPGADVTLVFAIIASHLFILKSSRHFL